MLLPVLLLTAIAGRSHGQVLNPPYFNLAEGRDIWATATCGESDPETRIKMKELYCSLSGASAYNPWGGGRYYSYNYEEEESEKAFGELRISQEHGGESGASEKSKSFVQGGQICEFCEAGDPGRQHPAEFMVDGTSRWWQSPPLSRGFEYNQVNITLNLEQEFHVAYVSIQMANSPRPGAWVLERSIDYGKTWNAWQYFAESASQCEELFGTESLQGIYEDDDVICTTEYAPIVPLENAQIFVRLLSSRPSRLNFTYSEKLQKFTRATNIRIRLLKTKTLQGHLMDLARDKDPSITRRYFYSIKEIEMGGRCVCNGHAQTCDILDPLNRPKRLLCRCEHNTCGDQCERCCPGFEQKQWRPTREGSVFSCEPCNCNGHSEQCEYDAELEEKKLSLDIHGNYEGGGRCLNCRDHTEGINCDKCSSGYFRQAGKKLTDTDVCQPCDCKTYYFSGDCAPDTGKCYCKERFAKEDCSECAIGYHSFPTCEPCDCNFNGTDGNLCIPDVGEACPCKETFGGRFCDSCADEYFGFPNCTKCTCNGEGSLNNVCSKENGQCVCKNGYGGADCSKCTIGYFGYPNCQPCNCDPSGTLEGMCDSSEGNCLCKPGYGGERCDQCLPDHYGYPACRPCNCGKPGATSTNCKAQTGQCTCIASYTGRTCDRCSAGYFDYPRCSTCDCDSSGSLGVSCEALGQCFCKPNFEGKKCDRCKANFYNYPTCEECNCNPLGVSREWKGCDQVPPGELCTCKPMVTGRKCNDCRPTYWNLQRYNEQGCEDCGCYRAGTVSKLNTCDQGTGQCRCKLNTVERTCDVCKPGFYNLHAASAFGCSACHCDVGGSFSETCDQVSGQCRCKPRVEGQDCTKPIDAHYYPNLWHMRHEAEDGTSIDNKPVRFAIDEREFANFSWRGFAVFSPIQEEIQLEVDVSKSNVYRILFHYVNPTDNDITATVSLNPYYTESDDDVKQVGMIKLPKTKDPTTVAIAENGDPFPFVLNPGKWNLNINTKQRLLLDYIVLLPSAYYEGTIIKEEITEYCKEDSTGPCLELSYPDPRADSANVAQIFSVDNGNRAELPAHAKNANLQHAVSEPGKDLEVDIEVSKPGKYNIIVSYANYDEMGPMLTATGMKGEGSGVIAFQQCPFKSLCREAITSNGVATPFVAEGNKITLKLTSDNAYDLALADFYAVPVESWDPNTLLPSLVCAKKENACLPDIFLPSLGSTPFQIKNYANPNETTFKNAEDLGFTVADPELVVAPLDEEQRTVDVFGRVGNEGHNIFLVHYYNPKGVDKKVDVVLKNAEDYAKLTGKELDKSKPSLLNSTFANAHFIAKHCPSVSGCRAMIRSNGDELTQFYIPKDFVVSLSTPSDEKAAVFVEKIIAVPFHMYTEQLLKPLPRDGSWEFVSKCSDNNFQPKDTSDFCKAHIFSLTTDFNMGAFPCSCDSQGSTAFDCEEFGGQCPCKENVIGLRCTRCRPGHFGFPDCRPCNCGFRQCHPVTGQCQCPLHVEGENCERCEIRAFGYDPLIGCQLCQCHPDGSDGGRLECDPMSGQCLCKMSVGGRKCDECLPGFYGFPFCYQCNCEKSGSTPQVCNQNTAACICKENVIGQSCETCRPGTFDLQEQNPQGCTNCFCFGVTNQCQSSHWKISAIAVHTDWASNRESAEAKVKANENEEVELMITHEDFQGDIYFTAPSPYLGKQINSYGEKIIYEVASQPKEVDSEMGFAPDIVITGMNTSIEFWSDEQPPDPKEFFEISAVLHPDKWKVRGGGTVTRSQLMMILYDIKSIHLKASYYLPIKSATIRNIRMNTALASDGFPSARADLPLPPLATSTEICECPAPYKGSSCEECAEGYYRVQNGKFLGSCVPCQCNGHARTCDPNTGVCLECEHNTQGDSCELCAEGFYGNPSDGTPSDCRLCPCPLAEPGNNFATACVANEFGEVRNCSCREGYTGTNCEKCAAGFFGEPQRRGEFCRECECNGNNDLTLEGACDHMSGTCSLCQNHTAGYACQQCEPWYYGDAVEAKNCSECSCNQCGSDYCDITSGKCQCKQNVGGENCDQCIEDAWGFDKCAGCVMCNCAEGALLSQCDGNTGQCPCKPGVEGDRCDRCKYGYWNYGSNGCTLCDCEADLSKGTVCDVNTGQCQCQEGATGPRCDTCIAGYLRIPIHGCLFCEECVHVLKDDLEMLGVRLQDASVVVSNISAELFSEIRLGRISKTLAKLGPEMKSISNRDIGFENVVGSVASTKDQATQVNLQADRHASTANSSLQRALDLEIKGGEVAVQCNERAAKANQIVGELKSLADSLGEESAGSIDRVALLKEAQAILQQLQEINMTEPESAASMEMELASEVLAKAKALNEKMKKNDEDSSASRKNLDDTLDNVQEHSMLIQKAKNNLDIAMAKTQLTKDSPVFNATKNHISKAEQSEAHLKQAEKDNEKAKEIMAEIPDLVEMAKGEIKTLNSTLQELQPRINSSKIDPEEMTQLVAEVQASSQRLGDQATALEGAFSGTRDSAENAVTAAKAYAEISKAIDSAREAAQEASESAVNPGKDKDAEAVESRTESMALLRAAGTSRKILINDLKTSLEAKKQKLDGLNSSVQSLDNELEQLKNREEFDLEKANRIAEEATEKLRLVEASVAEKLPKIDEMKQQQREGVDDSVSAGNDKKIAAQQLEEAINKIPSVIEEHEVLKEKRNNASFAQQRVELNLDSLRKKIALVRDMANRIKVGTRFEKGSSLKLKNPARITRSSAYTQLSLFFKTREDGLLFFLGNEVGSGGTRYLPTPDYMAVEIDGGVAKLVMDLGDKTFELRNNQRVTDNRWHKLEVERTGKVAKLIIRTEDQEPAVSSGNYDGEKSLLNLHQDISALYIGGVPTTFRKPTAVRSREFQGDIEGISYHDTQLGLWNFDLNGRVSTEGAQERNELRTDFGSSTGVRLDGAGYVVMNSGMWDPRKKSIITLRFKTLGWESLIFFTGAEKDFLSLELENGRILLKFDLGKGAVNIRSEKLYNDGEWHNIAVERDGPNAKLTLDSEDVVEGSADPSMFELTTGDVYYVGGIPDNVDETKVTKKRFSGCLDQLELNGVTISLTKDARSSIGAKPGCPKEPIKVIGFQGEGFLQFSNQSLSSDSISLRYRTTEKSALLLYIKDNAETFTFTLAVNNGYLILNRQYNEEANSLQIEMTSASDGHWHYVSATNTGKKLGLHVDDQYANETQIKSLPDQNTIGTIGFGIDNTGSYPAFLGCLGDFTFGGKVMDFLETTERSKTEDTLSMVGCHLKEDRVKIEAKQSEGDSSKTRSLPPTALTTPVPKPEEEEADRCALRRFPLGEREDSRGRRYGAVPNSRREYMALPEPFDEKGTFQFSFRATASNGIIFFTADAKRIDYIAVYLNDGYIEFSYNSGSGSARIKSQKRYLDNNWHTVIAHREQKEGTLSVDGVVVGRGESPGPNTAVDTEKPFFVGGVPPELEDFAAKSTQKVKPMFVGCLRDFTLNGLPFPPPTEDITGECSNIKEEGYFFGSNGGYAILDNDINVGKSFSMEMEVKPRTKNGILFSVSAQNGSDYLSLSLLNGELYFMVNNGGGVEALRYPMSSPNQICDGHWHTIKIFKKNNYMVLAVDEITKAHKMKNADQKSTDTDGPLYLAGVPEGYNHGGIITTENFVGCFRMLKQGSSRVKKDLDLSKLERVGDVEYGCTVN